MRQTHSAAPFPAICIRLSTVSPPAINASSAATIWATVRTWSLTRIGALDRGGQEIAIIGQRHFDHLALDRHLRCVRTVGGDQPAPIIDDFEAAERPVLMMDNQQPLPILVAALVPAVLRVFGLALRAGD